MAAMRSRWCEVEFTLFFRVSTAGEDCVSSAVPTITGVFLTSTGGALNVASILERVTRMTGAVLRISSGAKALSFWALFRHD